MTTVNAATVGIVLRRASRDDVARIATLIMLGSPQPQLTREEIAVEAAHPSYLDAFLAIDASTHSALFVAEEEGAVIGTIQVTLIPGLIARGRMRAKFESVHVAPERRGQGIGALMVAHALTFARENGAGIAELTSNKARGDAHRFYVRLGFEQSHEGFKMVL
ncbi:MAG TPA: GNAT family N-acetyltransferase [Bosea sp. (in: a-proteobacteria)]|jgi:GNAT superfamily N-acetyltransferase|uniref:GNAT family N-acetyltransferase n=1 Tax=Bosea sp. (in: a-proteobacteria) TaxID=1871050 RepID=UPI002E11FA05|nr:GNAT family N-acetyltransferase [Bosea sp. (in: a-proteobacteria)]